MGDELPERLKGIICMIENKQLSLAIDHLLKLIKEVDARHFGDEVK